MLFTLTGPTGGTPKSIISGLPFSEFTSLLCLKIIDDVCVLCCFDWCVLGLRFSLPSFFKKILYSLLLTVLIPSLRSFWNAYTVGLGFNEDEICCGIANISGIPLP